MRPNVNPVAQRLAESFVRLSKIHTKSCHIEGLRHNELFIMVYIKKSTMSGMPGIKVSELGQVLNVTPPTVTQAITGLEKRGFVERSMDKEDRRAVRIKLTEKGTSFMQKSYDTFMSSFNGLVEYLGEDKSNELAELLKKVFIYFNEIRESKL